ncbi:hypothetical protein EDD86DRAFT_197876, partial [Gorgonomyces haynaldii]
MTAFLLGIWHPISYATQYTHYKGNRAPALSGKALYCSCACAVTGVPLLKQMCLSSPQHCSRSRPRMFRAAFVSRFTVMPFTVGA